MARKPRHLPEPGCPVEVTVRTPASRYRQGCKEGLVLGPRDWPGMHSAKALCDGQPIEGIWRGTVREMVTDIEVETLAEHERNQTAPCGATAVLQKPPHYLPGRQKRGPAPQFHAASQAAWDSLVAGYREFWVAYQIAAEKVVEGVKSVRFPEDCFPSRLPYVPFG